MCCQEILLLITRKSQDHFLSTHVAYSILVSTGVPVQAAKFTALAMKDSNFDTVQIEYSNTTSTIVVKINGEAVDFTQLNPIPYTGNHIINWFYQRTLIVEYNSDSLII